MSNVLKCLLTQANSHESTSCVCYFEFNYMEDDTVHKTMVRGEFNCYLGAGIERRASNYSLLDYWKVRVVCNVMIDVNILTRVTFDNRRGAPG